MTLPSTNVTMCSPLREHKKGNKPIQLCATCALNIDNMPTGTRVAKWINITPAFWNGERYVCEHHKEAKNEH
jgi:hypothetical protein